MKIVERTYSPSDVMTLAQDGIDPVLARVFAARGMRSRNDIDSGGVFLPHTALTDADKAADLLMEAIDDQRRILVISDYDCDGATACAIAIRGLKAFGANVGYLIPNRLVHGYGLSPEIVKDAAALDPKPSLIITVDNGISSTAGIKLANELGMEVLVTDHHLPGETLPPARLIVNPNRKDCGFPSKALAGCGVMWYVLRALEDHWKAANRVPMEHGFTVDSLLQLVAIGTVADVVALDANNRSIVRAGLNQIRNGHGFEGVKALAKISRREIDQLTTGDIGFGIGPRINAAGRLEQMDTGVECLTTSDPGIAVMLAKHLDETNLTRQDIELETTIEACNQVAAAIGPDQYTAVAYREDWHKGVIGISAGRVRELVYRPTFIFTSDASGQLTGSGRSIPGFQLRHALDEVAVRVPGLLLKYGGHAMAAGATLRAGGLEAFQEAFEAVAREWLTPAELNQQMDTDGALLPMEFSLETVDAIRDEVWGQAFPEPTFTDTFRVIQHRRVGQGKHLQLVLQRGKHTYKAIKFRAEANDPPKIVRVVYKLGANTFQGATTLQLLVDHLEAA